MTSISDIASVSEAEHKTPMRLGKLLVITLREGEENIFVWP